MRLMNSPKSRWDSEIDDTDYLQLRVELNRLWRLTAASVAEPKSLYASRRPGTHLAAFSSVDIRLGIPPSSALRCTHLDDAKRKGT